MSRNDRSSARRVRLLSLAILMLNLSAAAAVGQTQRDGSAAGVAAPATGAADRDVESAAAATPVVLPETTSPPETTVPPAPPTTASSAPAAAPHPPATAAPPPPPPAPPAPPEPEPAPPAPPQDPMVRVQAAYEATVPAAWRDAVPVQFQLIEGNTSWASHDGTIQVGSTHYNGSDNLLRATIAHEFGHLIAFRYGSQAYNGAAPDGWPAYGDRPEEAWADCVSRVFSGVNDPSYGQRPCEGSSLGWTADWVGGGPGAHPRTGT